MDTITKSFARRDPLCSIWWVSFSGGVLGWCWDSWSTIQRELRSFWAIFQVKFHHSLYSSIGSGLSELGTCWPLRRWTLVISIYNRFHEITARSKSLPCVIQGRHRTRWRVVIQDYIVMWESCFSGRHDNMTPSLRQSTRIQNQNPNLHVNIFLCIIMRVYSSECGFTFKCKACSDTMRLPCANVASSPASKHS